nr:MAG TPA: hypothetical protein [Caudoviricetes sp.]
MPALPTPVKSLCKCLHSLHQRASSRRFGARF